MLTASASRGDVQATAAALAQGEFDFTDVPLPPLPRVQMRLVERRPDGTEEYTLTVKYERPKLRLAVREVAELLGCTPRTVYRYLDCGLLRGENLGRKMTRVFAESVQELRSRGAAE